MSGFRVCIVLFFIFGTHAMRVPAIPSTSPEQLEVTLATLKQLLATPEMMANAHAAALQKIDAQLVYIAALLDTNRNPSETAGSRHIFEDACTKIVQESLSASLAAVDRMPGKPDVKDTLRQMFIRRSMVTEQYQATAEALATWGAAELVKHQEFLLLHKSLLFEDGSENVASAIAEVMVLAPGMELPVIHHSPTPTPSETLVIKAFCDVFCEQLNRTLVFDLEHDSIFDQTQQKSIYGAYVAETKKLLEAITRAQTAFIDTLLNNNYADSAATAYRDAIVTFFTWRKKILLLTAMQDTAMPKDTQIVLVKYITEHIGNGEELAIHLVAALKNLKANTHALILTRQICTTIGCFDLQDPLIANKVFEALFVSPLQAVASLVESQAY